MDKERGLIKALYFKVDGSKKDRPKKRWKKVVEWDMHARCLQLTDVQYCLSQESALFSFKLSSS